jgi:hypothetical protein
MFKVQACPSCGSDKIQIYRPLSKVECLDHSATVTGEPVFPGFVLPLEKLWR